tara:strand:- start:1821 stop:2081 length:261 start_codon:yes stop_codon:yes gene_type:complete
MYRIVFFFFIASSKVPLSSYSSERGVVGVSSFFSLFASSFFVAWKERKFERIEVLKLRSSNFILGFLNEFRVYHPRSFFLLSQCFG